MSYADTVLNLISNNPSFAKWPIEEERMNEPIIPKNEDMRLEGDNYLFIDSNRSGIPLRDSADENKRELYSVMRSVVKAAKRKGLRPTKRKDPINKLIEILENREISESLVRQVLQIEDDILSECLPSKLYNAFMDYNL